MQTPTTDTINANVVQKALEFHWREAEHNHRDPFVVVDIQVTLEMVAESLGIRLSERTCDA